MRTRDELRDWPVLIIRSGYASDDLWLDAIAAARRAGRKIIVVDGKGRLRALSGDADLSELRRRPASGAADEV